VVPILEREIAKMLEEGSSGLL